jgi:hypothetical protein
MTLVTLDSDNLGGQYVVGPDPPNPAVELAERVAELTSKLESMQQQLVRIEALVTPQEISVKLPDGY